MIRYSYNRQVEPPAPFDHVSIRGPAGDPVVEGLPAQIDTAADRTVMPAELVARLGLIPLDELPVAAFGGQVLLVPSSFVEVAVRGMAFHEIEALAHPEEPYILLGRDVLNRHRLHLDGPGLALQVE